MGLACDDGNLTLSNTRSHSAFLQDPYVCRPSASVTVDRGRPLPHPPFRGLAFWCGKPHPTS